MGPGPVVFPGFRTPSYEALKYDTGFMAKYRVSSFQHRPPRMQSNLSQRLDLGVPWWEIARLGLRWSVLKCLVLSKNMIKSGEIMLKYGVTSPFSSAPSCAHRLESSGDEEDQLRNGSHWCGQVFPTGSHQTWSNMQTSHGQVWLSAESERSYPPVMKSETNLSWSAWETGKWWTKYLLIEFYIRGCPLAMFGYSRVST